MHQIKAILCLYKIVCLQVQQKIVEKSSKYKSLF